MLSGDSVVLGERGAVYEIPGQRGFGMASWQGKSARERSVMPSSEIVHVPSFVANQIGELIPPLPSTTQAV
jgi:hypothetical protein